MSTVYRIQCDGCGNGPYNCSCLGWARERLYLSDKHSTDHFLRTCPGMWVDFPHEQRNDMDKYHCGFSSIEQIFNWFSTEDLGFLRKAGFVLKIYDVMPEDKAHSESGSQVFFRREHAMLMGTREVPVE